MLAACNVKIRAGFGISATAIDALQFAWSLQPTPRVPQDALPCANSIMIDSPLEYNDNVQVTAAVGRGFDMTNQSLSPLLGPASIREVRIDFTDVCNLRCVYCAVSSKSYDGIDMPSAISTRAIRLVKNLSKFNKQIEVDVNGNGETTFKKDWMDLINPFLDHGLPVRIQSNFSKEFSEEELLTLSGVNLIIISIDSADRQLLRTMRRHVDLRQIIHNMVAVRATAKKIHRKPPIFTFSCGLYDKNSLSIEGLAFLALTMQVKAVGFWNLHDHGHTDNGVAPEHRAVPLDKLDDAALLPRMVVILKSIELLRVNGIVVNIGGGPAGDDGNFVNILARRLGIDGIR